MFGLIVAGRLVDTAPTQIDVNKMVFPVADPESVNHVVVFLTGALPFQEGYGGAVYLSWPTPVPSWTLLGFISNDKPSAIFRISKTKPKGGDDVNPFAQHDASMALVASGQPVAHIGVSMEPLAELAQMQPASVAAAVTMSDLSLFTQTMLESFYNFAASFGIGQAEMVARQEDSYVPIGVLNKWQESFLSKLARDPLFWKR